MFNPSIYTYLYTYTYRYKYIIFYKSQTIANHYSRKINENKWLCLDKFLDTETLQGYQELTKEHQG